MPQHLPLLITAIGTNSSSMAPCTHRQLTTSTPNTKQSCSGIIHGHHRPLRRTSPIFSPLGRNAATTHSVLSVRPLLTAKALISMMVSVVYSIILLGAGPTHHMVSGRRTIGTRKLGTSFSTMRIGSSSTILLLSTTGGKCFLKPFLTSKDMIRSKTWLS